MTSKEFLQQVFIAYQDAESKLEQIARIQSLATRTTSVIKAIPIGNGNALSSRVENAIMAIEGQSEYLADEVAHLLKVREEVSAEIAKLENPAERRILEFRYLCFHSWKEIANITKLGLRYVFKLHERALENFSVQFTKGHKRAY